MSIFSKSVLLSFGLIAFCALDVFSQSHDLYIVINEADWCKYCKANDERIHTLVNQYASDNKVLIVKNDVTDEQSKLNSLPELKRIGVSDYMSRHKETAVIFVFDAKSKIILDKFSLKTKDEKVIEYLDKSMSSIHES